MDVRLSDEQAMLQETAARIAAVHRLDNVLDLVKRRSDEAELWRLLADAGLLALRTPEVAGGMGATAVEVCLVAEQLGRALSLSPFVVQGALAPALLDGAGAGSLGADVVAGRRRVAVAFTPDLRAFAAPDSAAIVVDALHADAALTLDDGGVLRIHPLVAGEPIEALDLTRTLLSWHPAGGELLGRLDPEARHRAVALALAAVAADLVGVMQASLDESVAYMRDRQQFGRPIGTFQALQHLAADAAVLLEASRSSMFHAAWAVDALAPPAGLLAARQAKAYASRAARTVVEIATQCHGGVAITWEHLMHVRTRRVLVGDQMLGDVRRQLADIAAVRFARDGESAVAMPPVTSARGLDFGDSPEMAGFRGRLRAWLAENPAPAASGEGPDREMEAQHSWHQMLAAGGWVGLSFPADYGGRGLTALHEAILHEELGAAGAPPAPAINHITHAIRLFGTEDQKREHLPGMLSCRVRWCQGFSEPNAGSDLVSLTTRGERFTRDDGTEAYRVNGQKIWTSEAVWAHWCLLLLRTEADAAQHKGLSMLMLPMDTPGIEVRPIETAYGSREFAEVFFDDVIVPATHLLGAAGQGWEIAMALLGFERGPGDMGWTARLGRQLSLVEAAVRRGELDVDATQQRALAEAWVELEALRVHVHRSVSARLDGSAPGPEGSLDKLLVTQADQLLSGVLLEVLGATAVLEPDTFFPGYVWSRAQSIFGGTQQVQRNIVAQRVLGLPRSS